MDPDWRTTNADTPNSAAADLETGVSAKANQAGPTVESLKSEIERLRSEVNRAQQESNEWVAQLEAKERALSDNEVLVNDLRKELYALKDLVNQITQKLEEAKLDKQRMQEAAETLVQQMGAEREQLHRAVGEFRYQEVKLHEEVNGLRARLEQRQEAEAGPAFLQHEQTLEEANRRTVEMQIVSACAEVERQRLQSEVTRLTSEVEVWRAEHRQRIFLGAPKNTETADQAS